MTESKSQEKPSFLVPTFCDECGQQHHKHPTEHAGWCENQSCSKYHIARHPLLFVMDKIVEKGKKP